MSWQSPTPSTITSHRGHLWGRTRVHMRMHMCVKLHVRTHVHAHSPGVHERAECCCPQIPPVARSIGTRRPGGGCRAPPHGVRLVLEVSGEYVPKFVGVTQRGRQLLPHARQRSKVGGVCVRPRWRRERVSLAEVRRHVWSLLLQLYADMAQCSIVAGPIEPQSQRRFEPQREHTAHRARVGPLAGNKHVHVEQHLCAPPTDQIAHTTLLVRVPPVCRRAGAALPPAAIGR